MLVISRKADQRILIGDNVVITVIQVRGNQVRIRIEAPKEIHVLRAELAVAITELSTGVVPATVATIESSAPKRLTRTNPLL